jgi:hypothetical protein
LAAVISEDAIVSRLVVVVASVASDCCWPASEPPLGLIAVLPPPLPISVNEIVPFAAVAMASVLAVPPLINCGPLTPPICTCTVWLGAMVVVMSAYLLICCKSESRWSSSGAWFAAGSLSAEILTFIAARLDAS